MHCCYWGTTSYPTWVKSKMAHSKKHTLLVIWLTDSYRLTWAGQRRMTVITMERRGLIWQAPWWPVYSDNYSASSSMIWPSISRRRSRTQIARTLTSKWLYDTKLWLTRFEVPSQRATGERTNTATYRRLACPRCSIDWRLHLLSRIWDAWLTRSTREASRQSLASCTTRIGVWFVRLRLRRGKLVASSKI